jgi:hypothetical protein
MLSKCQRLSIRRARQAGGLVLVLGGGNMAYPSWVAQTWAVQACFRPLFSLNSIESHR